MNRRLVAIVWGAALLLAGCAGGKESRPTDATQLRRQMIARAQDSVPGTLVDVEADRLRVAPFRGGAPVTYVVPGELPVFLGGEPVDRSALRPGTEVNLFFVGPKRAGGEPRAVGVQLLSQGCAKALKQQF